MIMVARRLIWKVRTLFLDLRYGGILRGSVNSRHKDVGAHDVINIDYKVLPYVFKDRIKESDVLVDVGSGKGRVLNWWLSRGYQNKMIGIELESDVAEVCRQRLRKYKNVTLIAGDVCENIPDDATLIYLFNPFKSNIMKRFKDRLFDVFGSRGNITILYYNPWYIDVFRNDPNWTVEEVDLGFPSFFTQRGTYRTLAVIRPSGKEQKATTS